MFQIARILLFLQIVVLAAAIGAIVGFFGLILLGEVTGTSNINGGLAMGAAGFAPVSALVGALAGAWFGWRLIGRLGRNTVMFGGFGIAVLIALSVGGWLLFEELNDGNPYAPDKEPTLLIEWRLPGLIAHDEARQFYRHLLRTSYMDWVLNVGWDEPHARDENGQTILRLSGKIRWRVTGRTLQIWRFPLHDVRITAELGLGKDPKPMAEYGPWQAVKEAPDHAFRTRIAAD